MAPTAVTEKQVKDARLLLSWGVVQMMLGESRDGVSSSLVDILEQSVYDNLRQCEEWSAIFLKDLIELETDLEQIKSLNDHMKDYLTQSFRQRNICLYPTSSSRGKPFSDHISVIRKLNPELSRDLRLQGTKILDRLYECDVLSEADRQSILAHQTDKRKNEAFIDYLCSNFTTEAFTATVLPLLSKDDMHADLAEKIKTELDAANQTKRPLVCTYCKMKALVNPRKLSEALYELSVISESLKRDLCLSTQPSSARWEELFKEVQEEKHLLKALEKTYPHLYWEFQDTEHSVLKCWCFTLAKDDVAVMSDFTFDLMDRDGSNVSTITEFQDEIRSTSIQKYSTSSKKVVRQTVNANTSQQGIGHTPTSPSQDGLGHTASVTSSLQGVGHTANIMSPAKKTGHTSSPASLPLKASGSQQSVGKMAMTSTQADKKPSSSFGDGAPKTNTTPTEEQDIIDDKAELRRLEEEYDDVKILLTKESNPVIIKDNQGKLTSLKRLVEKRKQLVTLAEERKEKFAVIRSRILQCQEDYEQKDTLFQKVTASRMLEAAKTELEKVENDYVEKRRKIESSCVLM